MEFIHPVVVHPWGQRAMRLYDPDGHIIEIGETLDETVLHLHEEGLSFDAITQKTGMPREFVEGVIAKSR